jgi:uncharacterized protein (TIGR03083 family)
MRDERGDRAPAMSAFEPLSVIRAEADRMASLPVDGFDARVPACPDWDVTDLVSHTGWVHRWMTYMVRLPEGERPSRETSTAAGLPRVGSSQRPDGDLLAWFRAGAAELVSVLETTPSTKRMNSMFGEHQPAFIARRQAHETSVHRWDAETALGLAACGFGPGVAADGIDELLELWVPIRFDYAAFPGPAQVQLEATDSVDGWVIVVEDGATSWRRGHDASSAVTARGPLDELYLFVWNRLPTDRLDVAGDVDLLARWQRAASV